MKENIKILIVEDEAIVARCLCMELEMVGYEVCKYASSGEEAIDRAKEHEPNLILMDINLVGSINGIEAARQIHEHKAIPIIFMTGYSQIEIIDEVKEVNPICYFSKPIEIETLIPVIDKYFA
jgi:DNA-binding NarL/FixJ family response regulator